MEISFRYSMQCRENTINGVTPANTNTYDSPGYKAVINLGQKYIEEVGILEFSGNFQGDQYFVELWTAHIIFDHGSPNEQLRSQCLKIIEKYSKSPLTLLVAIEEKEWLKRNGALDS